MNQILMALILCWGLTQVAKAHDDGHGPKLSDTGQFGGLVSGVVKKSEASLGAKASLIYKAELVRSAKGLARLYLYDQHMKPLDLKKFAQKTTATLAYKVKGQWRNVTFDLKTQGGSFQGTMPKALSQPYSVDVVIQEGDQELMAAFDNLD